MGATGFDGMIGGYGKHTEVYCLVKQVDNYSRQSRLQLRTGRLTDGRRLVGTFLQDLPDDS